MTFDQKINFRGVSVNPGWGACVSMFQKEILETMKVYEFSN